MKPEVRSIDALVKKRFDPGKIRRPKTESVTALADIQATPRIHVIAEGGGMIGRLGADEPMQEAWLVGHVIVRDYEITGLHQTPDRAQKLGSGPPVLLHPHHFDPR